MVDLDKLAESIKNMSDVLHSAGFVGGILLALVVAYITWREIRGWRVNAQTRSGRLTVEIVQDMTEQVEILARANATEHARLVETQQQLLTRIAELGKANEKLLDKASAIGETTTDTNRMVERLAVHRAGAVHGV
ncbi:MAG TPA: hypothetical protein VJ787_09000 [Thermoleophilia bacterium]|nr:hypothetical protein [Thermoleophilia bacterium]